MLVRIQSSLKLSITNYALGLLGAYTVTYYTVSMDLMEQIVVKQIFTSCLARGRRWCGRKPHHQPKQQHKKMESTKIFLIRGLFSK